MIEHDAKRPRLTRSSLSSASAAAADKRLQALAQVAQARYNADFAENLPQQLASLAKLTCEQAHQITGLSATVDRLEKRNAQLQRQNGRLRSALSPVRGLVTKATGRPANRPPAYSPNFSFSAARQPLAERTHVLPAAPGAEAVASLVCRETLGDWSP